MFQCMCLRQSLSISENLDIASFRGLPAYPTFSRNGDGHHSLSSSLSGSMSPEPDQLSDREEKNQVPFVTSVSVGTKPVDVRPSAYVGFPEGTKITCKMNPCINQFGIKTRLKFIFLN